MLDYLLVQCVSLLLYQKIMWTWLATQWQNTDLVLPVSVSTSCYFSGNICYDLEESAILKWRVGFISMATYSSVLREQYLPIVLKEGWWFYDGLLYPRDQASDHWAYLTGGQQAKGFSHRRLVAIVYNVYFSILFKV